jgi:oligopeptide/dipeptide ABC transporter ATP-binding protein
MVERGATRVAAPAASGQGGMRAGSHPSSMIAAYKLEAQPVVIGAAARMLLVTALLELRSLSVEFPGQNCWGRVSFQPGAPEKAGRSSDTRCLQAVREVSFSLAPGEVIGLVGESGSGKSVTSLALMRLLPAQARVRGEILFHNGEGCARNLLEIPLEQMRRLRGARIAMIFQEPMTALNPMMRIGDQIAEAILAHPGSAQITKSQAWQRAIAALNEVAIAEPERRARDYPYQLSGGMRQRVMIAMSIANRPQLLIADEPTTALDVTIQAQILELLSQLRQKFGLAMLFISHDLAVVSQVADRVAVMYAGSLVELGPRDAIFQAPAHPYTRGLLHAVPTLRTDRERPLNTIEGTVPSLEALPPGCPFAPRCDLRIPECEMVFPPLVEVAPDHWARCPVLNKTS